MSVGSIVALQCRDIAQLEKLLRGSDLPVQDCAEQAQNFYGIFEENDLIAAGGLEPAQNYALLRSIVVHEQYRGHGLGRNIAEYLIRLAQSEGRVAVYLLTETAEGYFENLGFTRVARAEVPTPITETLQFTSLCSVSASCLVLTL